jgi:outer membrane receptor protein involved in Fe transport
LAIVDAVHDFWGVYLQDEITLGERWRLTLGGRYDRFERSVDFAPTGPFDPGGGADETQDAWSPKASLSYRVGDGQVYLAYGRGFGSNFGPVWQWDPNQFARDSQPTTIDSVELGWKSRLMDARLEVEAVLFALEQRNRPVVVSNPDPSGPPSLMTTGDRYESTGLELAARYTPVEDTRLWATYAYLDPRWERFELTGAGGVPIDLSGRQPTGVPRHTALLGVEHTMLPWLTVRGTYEYYDDYAISADNTVRGGGYELATLGASMTWPNRDGWIVDLAVTNLFDESYYFMFGDITRASHATPGPPRQFRLSLGARF